MNTFSYEKMSGGTLLWGNIISYDKGTSRAPASEFE